MMEEKEERFENEFVTWNHQTPVGIKVSEVFGMDSKKGKVWLALARQIYCEEGYEYREIDHYESGVPYLYGSSSRISITHTTNFFAVAILPKTPECDLAIFSPRTAMGIDAEPLDREQVIKLRERFLNEEELSIIKKDSLQDNIMAWTAKEALYKAALTPGLDFRKCIHIKTLPELDLNPNKNGNPILGEGEIILNTDGEEQRISMKLYAYRSYGCCVMLAFSPKCAKFGS